MKLTHTDERTLNCTNNYKPYFEKYSQMVIMQITGSKILDNKEKLAVSQLSPLLKKTTLEITNTEKTREVIEDVYLKNYTEEELQAFIHFFSTPEGQSFLKKNNQNMTELAQYTQQLTQEITTDKQLRKKFAEQLKEIVTPLMIEKKRNATELQIK